VNLEAVRANVLRDAQVRPFRGVSVGPVREGFRLDRTQRVAALLAWALTLIVALVSVWPAWRWWTSALALAPRGDVLIDRVDLVVLKELVQFDRASTFGMVNAALAGGVLLALLLNPFVGGGVVGLLTGVPTGTPAARRFFEAGAGFYSRFVRTLLYVGLVGAAIAAIADALGTLAADALSDRGLERAAILAQVLRFVTLGLVVAFFTAVLDLARIRIARADSRHVLVACADALRLALRRLGALTRIGAVFFGLLAVVATAALTLRASLPGGGWLWLALAVLLQQALAYARLRLRVSTIAALAALAPAHATPAPAGLDARFAEYDRESEALDAAE
jgi:hypothetical protein